MKKLIILFIVFTTIVFSACKKYKEGPLISFRSVGARITGGWQLTEYLSNGKDSLQYYNDSCGAIINIGYYEDYQRKFIIDFSTGKKYFIGRMNLSSDKKILNLISGLDINYKYFTGPFAPNLNSNWNILKLTNKELKVTVDINDNNYKMSFKKITNLNGKPI